MNCLSLLYRAYARIGTEAAGFFYHGSGEGPWKDLIRSSGAGFIMGAGPYHIAYTLATRLQIESSAKIDLWGALKQAPITGLRTAVRDLGRGPARNLVRRNLEDKDMRESVKEGLAGEAAAAVDIIQSVPPENVRIQGAAISNGSAHAPSIAAILKRMASSPAGLVPSLYRGILPYACRNTLIWGPLLFTKSETKIFFQNRHPDQQLTLLESGCANMFSGIIAALLSNPCEIWRTRVMAGEAWNGFRYFIKTEGAFKLSRAGILPRAIQYVFFTNLLDYLTRAKPVSKRLKSVATKRSI